MSRGYRALLRLYPTSFRTEYGPELEAIFERRRHQASGPFAAVLLWLEAGRDAVVNGLAAHGDLLRQDLSYTARTLSRSPGFTLTAILVTALGVGATTAAFSVADFVMLRPLPFREPGALVRIWGAKPQYPQFELSPPNYHDIKAASRSFEAMGAFHPLDANVLGEGPPRRLNGSAVTTDLLPIFGVAPLIGRLPTDRDGVGTVVLSYALWKDLFASRTEALGRTMVLDGAPRVIIGIMPPGFHFPSREVQFWLPMPPEEVADTDRTNDWFQSVARLRPGITLEQARSELSVIAGRLEQEYPKENARLSATAYPMRDGVSGQSRMLLLGLAAASLCVLLIACVNLANLLLARGLIRHRELVVRTALGAGRERLIRQLVTESLLLATAGGGLGVLVAGFSVPLLSRLVPTALPIAGTPSVDIRVLLFAAVLTGLTGLGFGVFPALRASRSPGFEALRDGPRTGGGRRARLRTALVVAEVMASVVLLVTAGLLTRALWRIQSTDPGFRPEQVLTLNTTLPLTRYQVVAVRQQYYDRVLGAVRRLPGVSSAAYISGVPMSMGGGIWPVVIPGMPATPGEERPASLRFTTPGFFRTLSIPLLKGRDVAETDRANQPYVAVVSASFAHQYWPGEDPIGKRFEFALSERTVVGVVGDVRVRGLERSSEPQVYIPYGQVPDSSLVGYIPKSLVVRSSTPTETLMTAIRAAVNAADPEQPISDVRALTEIVESVTAPRSVQATVLAAFALIAFLLAGIGIHGLLSFAVASRRHEFAVRAALGARGTAIVAMIMRQSVVLALAGIVPGILIAFAAGKTLESILAGIQPGDPVTFSAAIALCLVMTLAGSLVPVLRAVRIAPASALRAE
jgi:putative ABC transport system permease protein